MVERDGNIRRQVVADVTGKTLKAAICEAVSPDTRIITDEFASYSGLHYRFKGHQVVNHGSGQYAWGEVHTNTAESAFSLLKLGVTGIFHAVSQEHLHRYASEVDFRWNTRKMNNGERTTQAIKSATGKRLMYKKLSRAISPAGAA